MPVYGHFRISGNRPGVYAGLAGAYYSPSLISLCHARLRASRVSQRQEARKRA